MLQPGQHIQDRFIVEELVGRGGLAEVYRVRHLQLGSVHALKLLLFRKKSLADRLLLEGRIQAQLRHPNVVAVTDVVRHDGQYGLLMEYVDNITLEELIDTRGPVPTDEALRIVAPVLAGVHAAHQAGVLHRDLKPANVLLAKVSGGLVPKVSDFGIAKVLDEGLDGATRENVAMGTPGYMAPEQVLDARSVDARTDVFALAGMVYELISGRRAFADETGEVTLRSTLEGTFLPLHEVADGVPRNVSDAVGHGLARDREDRPGDVAAFAGELLADHEDLLAMVLGASAGRPLSLEPARSSTYQPTTEPEGGGPTLMPAPGSVPPQSPTYQGGQLAPESLPSWDATDPPRRRAPPLFWTGALLGVGLLLLGSTLVVLVAGPALGWFVSPEGTVARKVSEVEPGATGVKGTVRIRDGGTEEDGGSEQDSDQATGDGEPTPGDVAARPADPGTTSPAEGVATTGPSSGTAAAPDGTSTDAAASSTDATPVDTDATPVDTDAAGVADTDLPAADPDPEPGEGGGQADDPDASASTITSAGTTEPDPPEPDPPPRTMVMSPEAFLAASWDGRVFRQPLTLRILSERGGDVVGEGRIVLGAQQRVLRLAGTYDPYSGALYLKETNGNLVMRGTVSGSRITGTYQREGKGSPERLELVRR